MWGVFGVGVVIMIINDRGGIDWVGVMHWTACMACVTPDCEVCVMHTDEAMDVTWGVWGGCIGVDALAILIDSVTVVVAITALISSCLVPLALLCTTLPTHDPVFVK